MKLFKKKLKKSFFFLKSLVTVYEILYNCSIGFFNAGLIVQILFINIFILLNIEWMGYEGFY